MNSWRRRRAASSRDERGQVTTGLIVVMIPFLVAISIYGIVVVARGVDSKTKAQSAADSAALAGVSGPDLQNALNDIFTGLSRPGDLGQNLSGCTDFGHARASAYAAKNDAQLLSYCYNPFTGKADASVRMNDRVSKDAGPAEATATAASGLALNDCSFKDDPPPPAEDPPPGDEPPTGDEPPPPPPDGGTTLSCGSSSVDFVIDGATGLFGSAPQIHLDLSGSLVD